MKLTRNAVKEADAPFLFALYASTREFELSQVPWTPEQKQAFLEMQLKAQTQSYAATRPAATHEIIHRDGEPVGRLYLDRSSDGFHILDIIIGPAFRGTGIGSEVLNEILDEAARHGKPVTIYTETFNPSLRLFERLGFRVKSADGFLVLLEWSKRETAIST